MKTEHVSVLFLFKFQHVEVLIRLLSSRISNRVQALNVRSYTQNIMEPEQ